MALLGIFLFGTNYWLVYLAEIHLPSGVVAVVFSSLIFLNIINVLICIHRVNLSAIQIEYSKFHFLN